jgi:hypothetical protein
MALNLGVAAGIAKGVDDGAQLLIEALVSSATDVSTAGAGRIAAVCVSGLFMLTRRGRDVVLPEFTEMNIVFDRPASLSMAPVATENDGQIQSFEDGEMKPIAQLP